MLIYIIIYMIPFSKPDINKQDLKRVENTIKSGWRKVEG